MDISQKIYTSVCPICARERTYKTKQGYDKGLTKPCKSCSNSINRNGTNWDGNCVDCGKERDYAKSASLCKQCHNNRTIKYHAEVYRFSRYGTTREWYEEEVQHGCAICNTYLSSSSKIKRERGHIDHNHDTGKVRGVLCDLCNKGLGQFKDSIEILENAVKYLKERN
jgi:hypothetical protein